MYYFFAYSLMPVKFTATNGSCAAIRNYNEYKRMNLHIYDLGRNKFKTISFKPPGIIKKRVRYFLDCNL